MKLSAVLTLTILLAAATASAGTVTSIDSSFVAPGRWYELDIRDGGTASIASLTGLGGDLETNAPLPTGAARLTTGFANNDKAEIAVDDDYGAVDDILSTLQVGYSFHKASVGGGNAFAAPSLKLTFWNPGYTGDGFVTLVYEPSWNQSSAPGSSVAPPADVWTAVSIDQNTGLFWNTGGFGQSNSFGGPPLKTLAQWASAFDSGFLGASLIRVSVGVGTYNQGQNGYFDDVTIAHDGYGAAYDFEAAQAVPLPGAGWAGIAMLAGLGILRRRRR